ncbi:MAG: hypothetical protein Unbinned5081contig1001_27 [Prokaryotic dsDNA virus sp.]|nr:MAG: hypothetical protein Unbinned5081contig1001_27 [Prokaryotic dsDNA virus sp.]|tara:strand:- start:5576 stop:6358 length:783 start_codon:yes stop_codon:yes gene_type:complete
MSNKVVSLIQERVFGSPTKKSVAVYMADRASDDGSGIWTSKAHMAADTELSKRSVQNAIGELEALGLIKNVGKRKCQNGFTYEYQIVIEAVLTLPSTRKRTGAGDSPVQQVHVSGAGDSPQDVQEIHPNHPRTIHEPPNSASADLFSANEKTVQPDETDVLFDRFWKVFPKKAGKPSARKAFEKAIKRAPAEIIIKRATRYAEWLSEASATEFRPHPKHPQGWLNDDRWEAEELLVAGIEIPRRESYAERMARISQGAMQ